jgi:hypothetical protein
MQEHISYEYIMMTEVAKVWEDPSRGINAQMFNNMCNMVVYLTAQNLIWYLADEVEIPSDIQKILDKVDTQIMCLSSHRTADWNEKLQPSDFKRLQEFIEEHKNILKLGISSVGRTQDSDS